MFTQLHLQMWYLNFIQDNKLFYKNIQLFNFCVKNISFVRYQNWHTIN